MFDDEEDDEEDDDDDDLIDASKELGLDVGDIKPVMPMPDNEYEDDMGLGDDDLDADEDDLDLNLEHLQITGLEPVDDLGLDDEFE